MRSPKYGRCELEVTRLSTSEHVSRTLSQIKYRYESRVMLDPGRSVRVDPSARLSNSVVVCHQIGPLKERLMVHDAIPKRTNVVKSRRDRRPAERSAGNNRIVWKGIFQAACPQLRLECCVEHCGPVSEGCRGDQIIGRERRYGNARMCVAKSAAKKSSGYRNALSKIRWTVAAGSGWSACDGLSVTDECWLGRPGRAVQSSHRLIHSIPEYNFEDLKRTVQRRSSADIPDIEVEGCLQVAADGGLVRRESRCRNRVL